MTDKNKVNEVDLKAKVEPVVTEEVDQVRFNNDGYKTELSFGTFQVKELSAFEFGAAIVEFFEVFTILTDTLDDNSGGEFKMFAQVLKNKEVIEQLAKVMALYCGTDDHEHFTRIGIKDFKELYSSLKKVIHVDELKELFLEVDLAKYLQVTPSTDNP